MKPRADFACLNKSCVDEDGGAIVYELPIDATHCPKGHKRLRRLFNKVAIIGTRSVAPERDWRLTNTSLTRRADAMMQESYDLERPRKVPDMPTIPLGQSEREINLPGGRKFIHPGREQMAAALGLGGRGHEMTEMEIRRESKRDAHSVPAILRRTSKIGVPTDYDSAPGLVQQHARRRG